AHRSVPGTMNGPIFESSKLALYCPKKMNISHAKDLSGILISMRSVDRSAFENLKSPLYPNFQIQEILKEDASIFPTILSKNSGCAIIEERLGDFEKKFYPQIEKVYTFGFDVGLAWKIREGNTDLFNSLRRWFQLASRQDLVVPIIYRYTNALDALTDQDYLTFQKNTQARLKEYLELFRSSAQKAKIPWTLLAAVAYQESHLDNSAISHTGVQGLMQITQSTANFLGLEDRNNAQDAIPAAARYLGWIYSQWPIEAPYLERVKLTLASYNMGYQHVRDVQNWLIKKELNPYLWKHLKMGFEAKADQDLAQQFAWGNARGHETIHFVNRVLAFESLFKRKYTRSSIQQYLKETK
ncbi:MAG: transglycosylase SLT domain-containing protein, partial [Pseudobdellovibrionaceae bacterium]